MSRLLVVVALIAGCKRETSPEPNSAAPGSGSVTAPAAAPIDAPAPPPVDAPVDAPVAAMRPTEAQAMEAAKAWMAAVAAKKADALVAASDLPFQFIDQFNPASCGEDTLEDAKEIAALVPCFRKDGKLGATFAKRDKYDREPDIEYSAELPDVPGMLQHKSEGWTAVMPEAQRGSHAFVTFAAGHPKYWSDVLYAVFAVRIVDGVPKVGGVSLMFSQEGD